MENQHNNNDFGSDWRKPLRSIKYLLAALVILLVAGLAWGGWYYSKHKAPAQPPLITSRDPKLTDSEKANYQKEIDSLKNKLNDSNISADDKFKALANIGQDYYMIGELATAKDYDLQASGLKSEIAFIWEQLYQVARAMGDYKTAEQYIQRALELAPNNPGYQQELSEIKQLESVPR